jgi:hypothetical protein
MLGKAIGNHMSGRDPTHGSASQRFANRKDINESAALRNVGTLSNDTNVQRDLQSVTTKIFKGTKLCDVAATFDKSSAMKYGARAP